MDFKFPDVGEGIHEGTIVKWHVKEGDTVAHDDVLCEVETDKAIVEIPSPQAGVIGKLYHKEGEVVQVGEILATYGEGVGSASDVKKESGAGAVGSIQDADDLGENKGPLFDNLQRASGPVISMNTEMKVLPAIRKLAQEHGVDLATVIGTGDNGRITKEDIEKAAGKEAVGEVTYEELTPMRKAISAHLEKTKAKVVPVSQMHFINVTNLAARRKLENDVLAAENIKLSYLPFIIQAVCKAVKAYPRFNAAWDEQKNALALKQYVNMAIAVDTEDGLIVPVIKNAQNLNLKELAQAITHIAEMARDRSAKPDDLKGSSITITNYGSLGSVFATPIINYPDTCIVGVGAFQKVVQMQDGQPVERLQLPLTVTFDHRYNDGADCARFINVMAAELEG
ncbi:branched-chain alpha-keto acid dehydrogenase subunit E2 [Candidatus Peregrinibacteria bacterium CG11_big_fil_rev_8_21_14_0_20_41_10]|nr:MAG: branched-chain alpha-keto acid dehydrogenase subunit E2 [Candidatus Peregrinibacteria bacterium CG11_big_fil_rev_8_21_14_0_20_41_10]PJC38060.1 MAG: 2-oxo acid dehydrogenase subunit E2 [Candidatus Peregrinibacteria bacterium CG_4_9_14_0_2_um_filter_41_14]